MKCPSCGARPGPDVRRHDGTCPYCGADLSPERPRMQISTSSQTYVGGPSWEYESSARMFGLPLVHIASGIDPQTGGPRVAKGILAIGNVAVGVVALGGASFGGLAFGGASLGLVSFGGLAIGFAAVGGLALGGYLALGGLAISLSYAAGGIALAPCALSGAGGDPACFEPLLEKIRRVRHLG